MRRRPVPVLVAVVIGFGAGLSLAGCSDASDLGATTSGTPSGAPGLDGQITVLAAASLTESFTTIGEQFEEANPGVTVTFSFAASSTLAAQIADGAPADVFASASAATMDDVVAAGAAASPVVFATNSMEIVVPPANPGRVADLDDLSDPAVTTALCQPQVPCGATAAKVFTSAAITVTPVTLEPDVKSVLSKVQLGEVDAGVVYVTDVVAAGEKVTGIEIPDDVNASTSYQVASLARSEHADVAAAFVDFVLSSDAADVLSTLGFQKP
ncbi:molybdate ABC transporter substrate-binding protein [Cellulomonas sp. URHE0023]|uniref:molybdate ABC transporter substrate-binding protein n=1 Tax=Cellulomonas sp. URHE0023 TaxID=1380354 RepID=UPI000487131A|nr:molybdate ABC transporter substrate-binding protein [Cellulomonas sp. URHE0023]